jgi:histidine ammonia-lyase
VQVAPEALAQVAAARQAFLRLAARPEVTIYGVTSGYGDLAGQRLNDEERRQQAVAAHNRGASFGDRLPDRASARVDDSL